MNDNKPDRTQLKNIAVLGSTGSIGQQTLEVIGEYPDRFRAALLIAGRRVGELIEQARRCRPDMAKAIAEVNPVGLNPNKQMVVNLVKGGHFFILTQMYRLKNRI